MFKKLLCSVMMTAVLASGAFQLSMAATNCIECLDDLFVCLERWSPRICNYVYDRCEERFCPFQP